MARQMAILLAFCLPLSSCTYEEVNDVSLFKYRRSDDAPKIAVKTAGNLIPWTLQGVMMATLGACYVGIAYLQARSQESLQR